MLWRLIKSIRLTTRLALIALLFALPFSCLTIWLLVKGINANIEFAHQERIGDETQRPLENLLQALGRYQLRIAGATSTDAAALHRSVDEAFDAVEKVIAQYAEALQFTAAGLADRQRSQLAPAAVR